MDAPQPATWDSPELERLSEVAHFHHSDVPIATSDSPTFSHFGQLLLIQRATIPWPSLQLALQACFGSLLAVEGMVDKVQGGELGLQLAVRAIERVEKESLGREEEGELEDWVGALRIAAREKAKRHPKRESAPEPDVDVKPARPVRASHSQQAEDVLPPVAGPSGSGNQIMTPPSSGRDRRASSSSRSSTAVSETREDDKQEQDVVAEPQPAAVVKAPRTSNHSSSARPSRTPRLIVESSAPVVARKKKRAESTVTNAEMPKAKRTKSARRITSGTPRAPSPVSSIPLPTPPTPSTTPDWIRLISQAIHSLPISTGTLIEILNQIEQLHPSLHLDKKARVRVDRLLRNYICFECDGDGGEKGDDGTDRTMWSLAEQWAASALKGSAIARRTAWERDDDKEPWCICRKPCDGRDMLRCSNTQCKIEWYHDDCVGEPKEMWDPSAKWVCPDCSAGKGRGREKGKGKGPDKVRLKGKMRGKGGKFAKRVG